MKRRQANRAKIGDCYYYEKFVAFDMETTGFSSDDSRIIEIGAVRLENGEMVDRFAAFVNPGTMIPVETEELTGITNRMLETEAPIEVVLPKFIAFCEDSTLVAHNAAFARRFIEANCERLGINWPFDTHCDMLDTYVLSHLLLKKPVPYTIEAAANALGVSLAEHRRAEETAEAISQILYRLVELTAEKDREEAEERRKKEAQEAAEAGILDDMRHNAIKKVRDLSEQELKNGWRRISEAAVEVMVSNELTRREGLLIWDFTQIKSIKDEFYKDILRTVVNGFDPWLTMDMASNEYWLDEPTGVDAMVKYMQIKGVLLILTHKTNFELKCFFRSLIPKKLRALYEKEMDAWEAEADKKVEMELKKFREEFEVCQ